jgi:hypothetical protein
MRFSIANSKRNCLIALLLVGTMLASTMLATYPVRAQTVPAPTGDVSVVQSGAVPTTFGGATNTWTVTTGAPNVDGTTYKSYQIAVDVRIDNSLNGFDASNNPMSGIWGYSLDLNWSPSTLQLQKIIDGPYLSSGDDSPSDDLLAPASLIDNVHGTLTGGISDAILEAPSASNLPTADGPLVTLIFNVVSDGTGTVTVSSVLLLASGSSTGVAPKSINDAEITMNLASYPLTVTSAEGSPFPAVGTDNIPQKEPIPASVASPVIVSGTTYTCTGWTGTGSVSASGTTTSTTFAISGASSITWLWQSSAPTQTQYSLTVTSAYGSPNPSVGSQSYDSGTSVTASVTSPVTVNGASYTCTGWTGTGSVPASGTTTSTTFTITAVSTITWNWKTTSGGTPEALTVASAYGSPNPAVGSNSYDSGQSVTCTVPTTPVLVSGIMYNTVTAGGVSYACTGWTGTGSVPPSGTTTSTTFTITATSSITWNWILLPPSLDVYTNNGGQGWNASASPFGPEAQVTMYANVTDGGAPVSQQLITFNVLDSGTQIDSRSAATDSNGIATATFRLPITLSSGASAFGIVNITSTVSIGGIALNDSCAFMYNHLLETINTKIGAGDSYGSSATPSFSRNKGPTVSVSVTVCNINWVATSFYLTVTIYDNNNVPVAYVCIPEAINAALFGSLNSFNTQAYTATLTIPTFAFVGPATVYVNLFSGNPAHGGTPFCPEYSTQILIDAS